MFAHFAIDLSRMPTRRSVFIAVLTRTNLDIGAR